MNGFEGSFLGDSSRLSATARLECGVCWWIYDPARGDEVWQIAPGTPFTALPGHWRCPNCDAAPDQFMTIDEGSGRRDESPDRPLPAAGVERLSRYSRELRQAYRAVDRRMRELPVYNDKLTVEVTGMRRCAHGLLCVVSTPWCMNLVLRSDTGGAGREGTTREVDFPSGRYPFIAGQLQQLGPIESCSLFSPMDVFDDMQVVRQVAGEAMAGLFAVQAACTVTDREKTGLSRRQFLRPTARA